MAASAIARTSPTALRMRRPPSSACWKAAISAKHWCASRRQAADPRRRVERNSRLQLNYTLDYVSRSCYRIRSLADPPPRFGVSEAKLQAPGAEMRRGNEGVRVV